MNSNETSDDLRNRKLRQLWESHFEPFAREGMPVPAHGLETHLEAIRHIHVLLEMLGRPEEIGGENKRDRTVLEILSLWSLLAAEIGKPLMNALSDFLPNEPVIDRVKLRFLCKVQTQFTPRTHIEGVDPVAVFLPRWFFEEFMQSLRALDKGEVRPIFAPFAVGRHTNPHGWDLRRQRALEHVAFLAGQGVSKKIALSRVAAAMKRVASNTLKAWEKEMKQYPEVAKEIDLAHKAGKLSILFVSNPDYGKIGSNDPLSLEVLAKLEEFQREPLTEFGKSYDGEFGQRHNS